MLHIHIPVGQAEGAVVTNPNALRKRLVMLSCCDSSSVHLASKVVQRPLLLERIRQEIGSDASQAALTCITSTHTEAQISIILKIPLLATPPNTAFQSTYD